MRKSLGNGTQETPGPLAACAVTLASQRDIEKPSSRIERLSGKVAFDAALEIDGRLHIMDLRLAFVR
jgi:hypothetical protein